MCVDDKQLNIPGLHSFAMHSGFLFILLSEKKKRKEVGVYLHGLYFIFEGS